MYVLVQTIASKPNEATAWPLSLRKAWLHPATLATKTGLKLAERLERQRFLTLFGEASLVGA